MAELSRDAQNSVALQKEMFRLADVEHGLSVPVIARTRGIPASTVRSWARGDAAMPAWAIGALGLPDDITSIVLQPFSRFVVTDEGDGGGDYDALGLEALGLATEIAAARDANGPGGVRIIHSEEPKIKARARRVIPRAISIVRAA